jgi:hypothetical protein
MPLRGAARAHHRADRQVGRGQNQPAQRRAAGVGLARGRDQPGHPYIGRCRFGLDCEHRHEPDCAVKAAVETGEIAQMRYDSYIHILRHMPVQPR